MANVLIVYATGDGQTAKIARRVAETLAARGHAAELFDAGHPSDGLDLRRFQAAIVGAPIHARGYPRSIVRFVREHRQFLERVPSAFFSVGLAVQSRTSDGRAQTLEVVEGFVERTGFRPERVELFAGALLYTKYNPLMRFVMRRIVTKEGGDTDTSRDYEYTDWRAVERFAQTFLPDAVAAGGPGTVTGPCRPALLPPPTDQHALVRELLLACGVLASLVYVAADLAAAIAYPAYHSFSSRAISELMASGAPTERLVDPLLLLYDALMMAFAVGVWMSSPRRRSHVTGGLLFVYAALGLLGPTLFEMNVRGSGGNPSADIRHIALTGVIVVSIFAAVVAGAAIRGSAFRTYSLVTLPAMAVFGGLTALGAPAPGSMESSHWFGLTERVDIGLFLLWVAVLARSLWLESRASRTTQPARTAKPLAA